MKRRAITATLVKGGLTALVLTTVGMSAVAQRATQPIYRPRPGRPDGAPARGRLSGSTGGVAGGVLPGVFTVRSIDADEKILRLADDDGGTADVYVELRVFDLSALRSGDEVEVDFIVPDGNGSNRLTAAAIWKLERVSP
ncbi:MAG TPA: hypothetical protein VHQ87_01265 [Rhizobacter sp.]|jgi:hypothetical protein|nr:hypothetical protein [Rhizobacter sp.]